MPWRSKTDSADRVVKVPALTGVRVNALRATAKHSGRQCQHPEDGAGWLALLRHLTAGSWLSAATSFTGAAHARLLAPVAAIPCGHG